MTQFVYANNATTTLASPISNSALTFTVAVGTGNRFASPGAGQAMYVTFQDAATLTIREIVEVTSVSGDTFTIAVGGRGQQGTTALSWTSGSIVSQLVTAGDLANFVQSASLPSFGTTTNPVTFNNSGSGAASGTTFNGSAPVTVSYNTIGNFSALLTTNGYQKLPSGLIMQWGYTSVSATSQGANSITFPIPFPAAALSAQCSTIRNQSSSGGSNYVYNLTTTGMSIWLDWDPTTNTRHGYWFAIGH